MHTRPLVVSTLAVAAALPSLVLLSTPARADDRVWDGGHRLCRFHDSRIDESSGVAISSRVPDAIWTHNDSGDTPRWFLVSTTTCKTVATYQLQLPAGVPTPPSVDGENPLSLDWEDMARGVDAAGNPTLLFGDIGDNQQARPTKTIYEFDEPDGTLPAGDDPTTEQPVTLVAAHAVVLPQTPVDSETLLFDVQTRQYGIVTKPRDLTTGLDYTGKSMLYLSADDVPDTTGPMAMTDAGSIDFTTLPRMDPTDTNSIAATSGDISPDGRHLVVRAYYDAYEWAIPGNDIGAALAGAPERIPLLPTKQGEGIGFSLDGQHLFTTTEGTGLDSDPQSGVVDRYDLAAPAASLPDERLPALGLVAVLAVAGTLLRRCRHWR